MVTKTSDEFLKELKEWAEKRLDQILLEDHWAGKSYILKDVIYAIDRFQRFQAEQQDND